MRFFILKEFRGGSAEEYLRKTFTAVMRNLQAGLSQLDFAENFRSFIVEDLVLPAATSTPVRNGLSNGEIPRWRIILRQSGGGAIIDGNEEWTADFVYLLNTGASEAKVTAIFFR